MRTLQAVLHTTISLLDCEDEYAAGTAYSFLTDALSLSSSVSKQVLMDLLAVMGQHLAAPGSGDGSTGTRFGDQKFQVLDMALCCFLESSFGTLLGKATAHILKHGVSVEDCDVGGGDEFATATKAASAASASSTDSQGKGKQVSNAASAVSRLQLGDSLEVQLTSGRWVEGIIVRLNAQTSELHIEHQRAITEGDDVAQGEDAFVVTILPNNSDRLRIVGTGEGDGGGDGGSSDADPGKARGGTDGGKSGPDDECSTSGSYEADSEALARMINNTMFLVYGTCDHDGNPDEEFEHYSGTAGMDHDGGDRGGCPVAWRSDFKGASIDELVQVLSGNDVETDAQRRPTVLPPFCSSSHMCRLVPCTAEMQCHICQDAADADDVSSIQQQLLDDGRLTQEQYRVQMQTRRRSIEERLEAVSQAMASGAAGVQARAGAGAGEEWFTTVSNAGIVMPPQIAELNRINTILRGMVGDHQSAPNTIASNETLPRTRIHTDGANGDGEIPGRSGSGGVSSGFNAILRNVRHRYRWACGACGYYVCLVCHPPFLDDALHTGPAGTAASRGQENDRAGITFSEYRRGARESRTVPLLQSSADGITHDDDGGGGGGEGWGVAGKDTPLSGASMGSSYGASNDAHATTAGADALGTTGLDRGILVSPAGALVRRGALLTLCLLGRSEDSYCTVFAEPSVHSAVLSKVLHGSVVEVYELHPVHEARAGTGEGARVRSVDFYELANSSGFVRKVSGGAWRWKRLLGGDRYGSGYGSGFSGTLEAEEGADERGAKRGPESGSESPHLPPIKNSGDSGVEGDTNWPLRANHLRTISKLIQAFVRHDTAVKEEMIVVLKHGEASWNRQPALKGDPDPAAAAAAAASTEIRQLAGVECYNSKLDILSLASKLFGLVSGFAMHTSWLK